ncbi:MAG: beta-galactosidase, partial [Caldilineaceae bacterium]|nr:beta-galactosidase [Caldilineaceae bacterium]
MARTSIRLIRLACLYAIICYLGVEIALSLRELRETDASSLQPPVVASTSSSSADQIPFLGVTVELEQYEDPHQRQQALHRLHGAGFGWVRQRIDWGLIEPQPGEFQWGWTDEVLSAISVAGLVPVVVLD